MSSQSHKMACSSEKDSNGEVEHTEMFSNQMAELCMSERYSDVTFNIQNQKIPAHVVILAARSEYFRALLFGGLAESKQKEIQLQVPVEAFKALLTYIYSGHLSLTQMSEETILDVLGLVNQYGFIDLELAISDYLRGILSLGNVCAILDTARLYGLVSLQKVCHIFMDQNANDILTHESFKNLSEESLKEILLRDSFFAPEVQIFIAVSEWCKHNSSVEIESVVSYVRLPLMTLEQLLKVVRYSGILNPDKLLDAINEKTSSKKLPYRGSLWPEENVATPKFGARTVQGEWRSALLDGDTSSYDLDRGYTRHSITDANDSGIVVDLSSICIINHIKLLLWDLDYRWYSYFIDVSVDQTQWERVVDHQSYRCRSWQFLYFPSKPVRYIKLVGTNNSINRVFHVITLSAYFTAKIPKMINGIVMPTKNVATVEMGATVVDGVCRLRNALLNGDTSNYDWDSGYTCHQLNSGSILIRLGQPYYIGSMRLLLWDCDDRTYGFYIQTSTNGKDYEIVVDKRKESCKSWQNLIFEPKVMTFIKIIGTYNSANEVFHCVNFECPSQKSITAEETALTTNTNVEEIKSTK